jgi:hypothetical protein
MTRREKLAAFSIAINSANLIAWLIILIRALI